MYIVIAGGGKIGEYLANVLLQSGNDVAVIEENLQTADHLSIVLEGRYLVIHGDGCDSKYQEDAGIRKADVFVATTGQDDDNLVSCEIAQRVFNVPRCIARVNNPKNLRIFREVGIESVSSTTLIATLIEEETLLGSVSVRLVAHAWQRSAHRDHRAAHALPLQRGRHPCLKRAAAGEQPDSRRVSQRRRQRGSGGRGHRALPGRQGHCRSRHRSP